MPHNTKEVKEVKF